MGIRRWLGLRSGSAKKRTRASGVTARCSGSGPRPTSCFQACFARTMRVPRPRRLNFRNAASRRRPKGSSRFAFAPAARGKTARSRFLNGARNRSRRRRKQLAHPHGKEVRGKNQTCCRACCRAKTRVDLTRNHSLRLIQIIKNVLKVIISHELFKSTPAVKRNICVYLLSEQFHHRIVHAHGKNLHLGMCIQK